MEPPRLQAPAQELVLFDTEMLESIPGEKNQSAWAELWQGLTLWLHNGSHCGKRAFTFDRPSTVYKIVNLALP